MGRRVESQVEEERGPGEGGRGQREGGGGTGDGSFSLREEGGRERSPWAGEGGGSGGERGLGGRG